MKVLGRLVGGNKKESSPTNSIKALSHLDGKEDSMKDSVKKLSVPINVFDRQPKEVTVGSVKLNGLDEEIILNILEFMLDATGRENFQPLVQCGGISRKWSEICSRDQFWRFTLARFQMDNPDVNGDLKSTAKETYFECLKKKSPERYEDIKNPNRNKNKVNAAVGSKPQTVNSVNNSNNNSNNNNNNNSNNSNNSNSNNNNNNNNSSNSNNAISSVPVNSVAKKSIVNMASDPQEVYFVPLAEIQYQEDSAEDSIQWKEKGDEKTIEAATLNRLVANLTSPTFFDTHFLHTFMITYRGFSDRDTIFAHLVERYSLPPPSKSLESIEEFNKWKTEVLDRVRLRVVQTIKYWIENFFVLDFDEDFVKKVQQFVEDLNKIKQGDKKEHPHATILLRALEKVQQDANQGIKQTELKFPPVMRPQKSLFVKKKKEKILDWPSLEVARQICLIDYESFKAIEPKECLNSNWSKGNQKTKAPNIYQMTAYFNLVSNWVGTTVVQTPDLQDRIKVVENFIDIADKLYELNNFNMVFSITAGMGMSSVFRLKKTWAGVSEDFAKLYSKFKDLMATKNNFEVVRNRIKQVKPPCIPYIGLYLTDLTFVEDGNPKFVKLYEGTDKEKRLINFFRSQCFAGIIRDMQTYQKERYIYEPVPELKEALSSLKVISEKEMYDLSCEVEPKQKK